MLAVKIGTSYVFASRKLCEIYTISDKQNSVSILSIAQQKDAARQIAKRPFCQKTKRPQKAANLLGIFREFLLAILFAEGALHLAFRIAFGQSLALVVQFFTSGQGNFQLGTAVFQVKHGWNGR